MPVKKKVLKIDKLVKNTRNIYMKQRNRLANIRDGDIKKKKKRIKKKLISFISVALLIYVPFVDSEKSAPFSYKS